jgi:cell filamentation protein
MPACAGDPYKYPGSDVLRNKAELRDAQALKQFEYEQTYFRAREVRGLPIPQRFDLKHLRALHKHLFQDVYDWAGELRTVEIGKGSSQFASPLYIESEGRRMSAAIAAENNLRGLDKARFVQRLSHHYGDWNALHPFREGNGRVTREFLGQLARGAGYELDQELIENRHGQWNEAARRSMVGELSGIEGILSVAVRPSRAVAMLSKNSPNLLLHTLSYMRSKKL